MWKLISIFGNIDQELAKLFADNKGQEAVIEILIAKQQGNGSIPYIRILNGLVQIPSLVSRMLDSGLAETVKIINDLYPDDVDVITMNFDTMKKISNQKVGRDFLITKGLVDSILKNINHCANLRNAKAVLSGLTVLDNLTRNDNGKEAIKKANGIDCLSNVLSKFETDDDILKMCAKIYSKIATNDDMKAQLEMLQKFYDDLKQNGSDSIKFSDLNKSLVLISNFMLVDEICKMLCEKDNLTLLENLFTEITKVSLDNKTEEFVDAYLLTNKYFMIIFYRIFAAKPEIYDKSTQIGKEKTELIKKIQSSLVKIWESIHGKIETHEAIANVFRSYWNSYNDIIYQNYISFNDQSEVDKDYIKTLEYMVKNIIVNGKKYFETKQRPNFIASRVLKTASVISKDLLPDIEKCYEYLMYLLTTSDNCDTLSNVIDVLYSLLTQIPSFKSKNIDNIIVAISQFALNKHKFRYPSLVCLKIFDLYLTTEFLSVYLKSPDANNKKTHAVNYVNCICSILTDSFYVSSTIARPLINTEKRDNALENEISELSTVLLKRLIDLLEFKTRVKHFKEQSESFDSLKANNDAIIALENSMLALYGLMTISEYYNTGAEDLLSILKDLIAKEVSNYEMYKRDKERMKDVNYFDTLRCLSNRICTELSLVLKINDIAIKNEELNIVAKSYDIIFAFLNKSSDITNIKTGLDNLNSRCKFILDNEAEIHLEKKEIVSEKHANINVVILRRLIEEEEAIREIINSLIIFCTAKASLCNILVKGGCPRMLLQIMENTPNPKTAEMALELLKIIAFSNPENLTMVANQNVLLKFYELRAKYAGNDTITSNCDLISNEIMKLPGQEKYAEDVINEALNEFNENAKLDYSLPETKSKLLANIEVINAFTTNKKIIELLLKGEFLNNLNSVFDKTVNDKEVSQVNEKLLTNELSLFSKIKSNCEYNNEIIVDKLLEIIRNKSNYNEILLFATRIFGSYLKDENQYNNLIAKKIDTSFIDLLFDISDNYLDDAKVSKELNNILCLLCLRNEQFAAYIKQRGGLSNVLEDLKADVFINDPQTQQIKLNSLKMLNSLISDDTGLEMFIKANGVELINNLVKNETNLLGNKYDEIDKGDLYITNETLQFPKECQMNNAESYFVHVLRIIKSGVQRGKKSFLDDKTLHALIYIAIAKYPDVLLVKELCEIVNEESVTLPENEIDRFAFLKCVYSIKAKFDFCDKCVEAIETANKAASKMSTEVAKSDKYITDMQAVLKEANVSDSNINIRNLLLTYLSIAVSDQDRQAFIAKAMKEIAAFYGEVCEVYLDKSKPLNENLNQGVVISIMRLAAFLLKQDKKSISTTDLVEDLMFLGCHFYDPQNADYVVEFLRLFDLVNEALGKYKSEDKKELSKNYVDYLQNMHSKSFEFFDDFTANLKECKDYSLICKNKKKAIQYILNDTKTYYSSNDDLDIKAGYTKQLIDALNELSASLLDAQKIPSEEQVSLLQSIWSIIRNALTNPELTDFVFDEKTVTSLFTSMHNTINLAGYKDTQNNFPSIINAVCSKTENNNEIFEKIIEYISRELSSLIPTETESIDTDISSLANLSKYSIAMKLMLNKVLLMQKLREFYDDDKISAERRRNLAVIYSNAVKNSYNIDTLVVNEPQTFKVLAKRIASPDTVIKEKENFDIAANEIDTVNTIMKDRNNYKTMGEKELIQEGDLQSGITNYEKCEDELVKPKVAEAKNIIESHQSLKREQTNLEMDENILQNLKKRIEAAFDSHINEVDKATPSTNTSDEKEKEEKSSKDLGFVRQMSLMVTTGSVVQKASNVKKGRLSIISRHLFYNEHNAKIISPISTKSHEDIASALDSLLALTRSIYNTIKNTTDNDFKKKREALLLEALRLLKMLSICPDNHQPILVLGLLGFMERLVEDHVESFLIYIACLDILKNCTWSESAVLTLIESPLLDKLIDEVIVLYTKPEELIKNDELKSCFLYNNINFSNMCKYPKGFEIIFKKIGIEKLRELGLRTGNVDFLAAIIEMFINYINNNPKEELKDDLVDDILKICEKALSLPDKTESVFAKALKLLGMVYKPKLLEKVQKIEIEPKVNECFDSYKTEPDFMMNCIYTLAVIAVDDNKVSTAIVDSKLLDKIINEVMNSDLNNELIENLSLLYKNLLLNNTDNQTKMCKEEIVNNIIFFIQRYQKKCKPTLRSCATMNPALLNEKIQAAEGVPMTFDKFSIENRILINLITALELITKQEGSMELISKSKFLATLLETIEKPNTDMEIIKVSLHCMGNYFVRDTSDYWKHYEIELLYNILKALLKQYYANSELLKHICQIAGYILKGFDSRLYTEKFYLLVIECLNCQDWNLPLVVIALNIVKDSLTRHENLRPDVFETTKQSLVNLLRLYYNNVEIQVLCFDIFSLFNTSHLHMYFITHEVIPFFLEALQGSELNAEESGKVAIRKSMLNLIFVLSKEEGNAETIACELMKPLLLEIDNDYSESLVLSEKIIVTLLNKSTALPAFIDNSGIETMMNTLNKNQAHPDALLVAFRIIASYINGSEQNKNRAKEMKFEEIINFLVGKNEKSRKIAFEGKNLVYLLNYVKGQKSGKEYMPIDISTITTEKLIKTKIKSFLTRGKIVKIVNPKGKVKEMQLMFSQDLLKVYCKKLKVNLPPKPKYLIETPHIVKTVKGHGTEIFKKTKGVFRSAPKQELCFSILGTPDGSKSINVECESEAEVENWVSSIDMVVNYIKSRLA